MKSPEPHWRGRPGLSQVGTQSVWEKPHTRPIQPMEQSASTLRTACQPCASASPGRYGVSTAADGLLPKVAFSRSRISTPVLNDG